MLVYLARAKRFFWIFLVFITINLISTSSSFSGFVFASDFLCPQLNDESRYVLQEQSLKKIVAGKEDWLFISEADFNADFILSKSETARVSGMIKALSAQNIKLVVALIPPRGWVQQAQLSEQLQEIFEPHVIEQAYVKLRKQLIKAGAIVPDLLAAITPSEEQEFYLRHDHHWSAEGAQLVAKVVADAVKKLPVYEGLRKKKFITEKQASVIRYERINDGLKRLCGESLPAQKSPYYITLPEENDPRRLLSSDLEPDVVLVGTSFGEDDNNGEIRFNFSGFLKAYLQVDLLNYAVAAEGVDGSFLHYFLSPEYFQGHKPKLIVWEFPVAGLNLMRLKNEEFYQQLEAAIKKCEPYQGKMFQRALSDQKISVGQKIELLANAGPNSFDLSGFDGHLMLNLSEVAFNSFHWVVQYEGGTKQINKLQRYPTLNSGLYYMVLDRASHAGVNIESIYIDPQDSYDFLTNIEFALCR